MTSCTLLIHFRTTKHGYYRGGDVEIETWCQGEGRIGNSSYWILKDVFTSSMIGSKVKLFSISVSKTMSLFGMSKQNSKKRLGNSWPNDFSTIWQQSAELIVCVQKLFVEYDFRFVLKLASSQFDHQKQRQLINIFLSLIKIHSLSLL